MLSIKYEKVEFDDGEADHLLISSEQKMTVPYDA